MPLSGQAGQTAHEPMAGVVNSVIRTQRVHVCIALAARHYKAQVWAAAEAIWPSGLKKHGPAAGEERR